MLPTHDAFTLVRRTKKQRDGHVQNSDFTNTYREYLLVKDIFASNYCTRVSYRDGRVSRVIDGTVLVLELSGRQPGILVQMDHNIYFRHATLYIL